MVEKPTGRLKGTVLEESYISIFAQICFLFIYPARVPWMVCHSSFDFWWWSCSSTTYWTGVGMTLPLDRTSTYSWQKFTGHDEAGISIYFHVSHTLKWISTGYISIIPPKKERMHNCLQRMGGQRSAWVKESLHLWVLRCSLFQVPFDGCSARYQQTIPPRRGSMHRRL